MDPISLQKAPTQTLLGTFFFWKNFLLAIALGASVASTDFDTSTDLFFARVYPPGTHIPSLATSLTRWDALYFMHASLVGKVYEQEWAFGYGLSTSVALLRRGLEWTGVDVDGIAFEPLAAIFIAHASHLVAVLALYQLTLLLFGNRKLALLSGMLHVISPAGLFLSAPYAESPFAALSFVGNWLFALGLNRAKSQAERTLYIVAAGISFGLSTTFRSNGLFSGLLFAVEAVKGTKAVVLQPTLRNIFALTGSLLGGSFIALGTLVPQAVAWLRYCNVEDKGVVLPPWCSYTVPSIYTYVQRVYWNVGFLKYWTPNQIPLFLLAAPMLTILLVSGVQIFKEPLRFVKSTQLAGNDTVGIFVRSQAAIQVILAILAITTYHVQIITRLASGYPVWYWWVAGCLLDKSRQARGVGIVVFMVMYAGIQGGLYASFLPPA